MLNLPGRVSRAVEHLAQRQQCASCSANRAIVPCAPWMRLPCSHLNRTWKVSGRRVVGGRTSVLRGRPSSSNTNRVSVTLHTRPYHLGSLRHCRHKEHLLSGRRIYRPWPNTGSCQNVVTVDVQPRTVACFVSVALGALVLVQKGRKRTCLGTLAIYRFAAKKTAAKFIRCVLKVARSNAAVCTHAFCSTALGGAYEGVWLHHWSKWCEMALSIPARSLAEDECACQSPSAASWSG